MTKTLAWIFGAVFLLVSALRFLQGTDEMILGLHVNATHNLVHLVTGIGFILAAMAGYSGIFFKVFGLVYALVAVAGFALGELPILGIPLNGPDNIFHAIVAAACLAIGFRAGRNVP
jgi:hypothetical protein